MTTQKAEALTSTTEDLIDAVKRHTVGQPDFWDFKHLRSRSGGHALFQYPAMMVPELQGTLLDDLKMVRPETLLVYDPFMGSGTIMLECITRGLDFHGSDINPLAVLLSHVKSNPPTQARALTLSLRVHSQASTSEPPTTRIEFPGVTKWFTSNVARDLNRLRSAIQKHPIQSERQYLWICLAETVRIVSNSRTSTFKLHIYDEKTMAARDPDALKTFLAIGRSNAGHVGEHWKRMRKLAKTAAGDHASSVKLLRGSITEPWSAPKLADIIMTSPPYGDNRTTVPYGQHSYLPLCWIDPMDLVGSFYPGLLATTATIDTLSLGGSIRESEAAREALFEVSPSLKRFVETIEHKPSLSKKVLAFGRDYAQALETASDRLRDGGFSFWTLGQRRVDDREMPLVAITTEILESLRHAHVHAVHRNLPLARKRMAGRNGQTATMGEEQVLIMQKAGG